MRRARPHLSLLAGLGLAVLPKCPVCWLAYTSLLGAVGLGRLPYQPWLLPALAVLLALATLAFWLTGRRRSRWPGILALTGAILAVTGKFWVDQSWVTWVGVAFLAAAAVWDFVASRRGHDACGTAGNACSPSLRSQT